MLPHAECVEVRDREKCVASMLRRWRAVKEAGHSASVVFPDGMPRSASYSAGASVPNRARTRELELDRILGKIGPNGRLILLIRMTARAKSAASSWEQIAAVLARSTSDVWTVPDVKQAFDWSVGIIHRHLEQYDLIEYLNSEAA